MTRPVVCFALILLATHAFAVESGTISGLYYETAGTGEPVVFVHGGQMDRRMWDEQFDRFAEKYRVIRYDIRGFGKSEMPDKSYSDAADLHAVLEAVGVKKAALIGLSLGAAISVDFALSYSNEVNSLVLVCPGLGGFSFQDKANDLRAVARAAREGNFDLAAELWLKNPYMSVAMEKPGLSDKLRQLARENGRCWLKNPLLNRALRPSAAGRLPEIGVPTLVIGGERDVSDIHKIVAKLVSEIPGAEKKIVEGGGHLVPMETPEIFNATALEFLAKAYRK